MANKMLIGIIFITLVSLLFFGSVVWINLKMKALKKLENKRVYYSKKILYWFYAITYCVFPIILGLMIGLIVYLNIYKKDEITGLNSYLFTGSYLAYIVFIFVLIIVGTKLYKAMLIVEANESYYFLDNTIIKKKTIIAISNTLKRNYLVISYSSESNLREVYQVKYSWQLKDFFDEK
ncbi:hypothetical protein [Spiroplasma tabanidicola]|uniref:Transmembrane protein n=1 Tax=Spiroplasma tabanidicola TaxID=324079 RepID=A0A6I6C8L0_9MOLU|nr:hypothetical protein [Spiroplasma tabanidicola]QGS52006.1 hypothetical protein STABA_v1c06450 [Spiroplasma tabanidicola]